MIIHVKEEGYGRCTHHMTQMLLLVLLGFVPTSIRLLADQFL